jgi:organic radical activating enzyme
MADGDGCFWTLKHRRGYRRFRLALNDGSLLERAEAFASTSGHELRRGVHNTVGFSGMQRRMQSLWLTSDVRTRDFENWLATDVDNESWCAGYLGGILDAEGSYSCGAIRIAQYETNAKTRARISAVLERLGLGYTLESHGFYVHHKSGGAWRALALAQPAKRSLRLGALGHHPHVSRTIETVVPTNQLDEVVTLSTTVGSFIAGGYVVKNCDTKYTWQWDRYDKERETSEVSTDSVLARIIDLAGDHSRNVVITGGEPLLQQPALIELSSALHARGFRVEVETNGTVEPEPELAHYIDQWNVSPKLENSGNKRSARLRTGPLTWFAAAPNAYFKFVVAQPSDMEELKEVVRRYAISPERVVLMPEGTTPDALQSRAKWLVDECRLAGFRFGTRLHVLLWGDERGR